jgi:hypothetical protein
VFEVEKFHGRTCNSVYQEIYAATIMIVITRTLMVIASETNSSDYQLNNAIMTLASEVAVLAPDDPQRLLIPTWIQDEYP